MCVCVCVCVCVPLSLSLSLLFLLFISRRQKWPAFETTTATTILTTTAAIQTIRLGLGGEGNGKILIGGHNRWRSGFSPPPIVVQQSVLIKSTKLP